MSPSRVSTTQSPDILRPMNLYDEAEFEELLKQRVICGWNNQPANIVRWREMMDSKQKSLFWIVLPDTNTRVGHISLDCATDPPDLELANPDKSVLTISTFFILPEYRSTGLGRLAMDVMEDLATKEPYGSPNCRAIAVHTLDRRYTEGDSEEWRKWAKLRQGQLPPKGRSTEDWYARRGYVKWREEPRYPEKTLDGQDILLNAVFLRKRLQ
ncbi:hypothetical protein W97_01253 [Coniosporium apollinis CBS 100218]|uniref:N-acetyltransferase domain-containing protein n=1 Tax=Coniosporium apollinis (strain CBS 100218) TaxID=1168221 RepID=R7YJN6_CONA1|nr:uncharacterized protein W97_01253 [Coniosporium apollinis CBS 100218]EON62034.1 hypothetical protein W97_01253 [Coniosporium apollinis CBS 100218]